MWKCNIKNSKVRLYEVECVLNPAQGFRYLLLHCKFTNGKVRDFRTWYNDSLKSLKSIQALSILSAWTIFYKKGNGLSFTIYNNEKTSKLSILYIDKKTKQKTIDNIPKDILPKHLRSAINYLIEELSGAYGTDYYLDI